MGEEGTKERFVVWKQQTNEEEDMLIRIANFALDENGAVTVDWVILCAGVISLALAAVGVITDGTENLSGEIDTNLKNELISTSFDTDGDV